MSDMSKDDLHSVYIVIIVFTCIISLVSGAIIHHHALGYTDWSKGSLRELQEYIPNSSARIIIEYTGTSEEELIRYSNAILNIPPTYGSVSITHSDDYRIVTIHRSSK